MGTVKAKLLEKGKKRGNGGGQGGIDGVARRRILMEEREWR